MAEPAVAFEAGDGWSTVRSCAFTGHVGPVYQRTIEGRTQFAFEVQPRHDNTQNSTHGGMIMTLCDEAMGIMALAAQPGRRVATIAMTCQFIGATTTGDRIVADPVTMRVTASLVFMECTCRHGERIVATATGIWKVIGGRAP